ncbi:MAG: hypothetical protein KJ063_00920 [Anaerolineae bacterium]|nr:hypothetical protein [Anaerolineae bacterium]
MGHLIFQDVYPFMNNWLGLILCFGYVLAMLGMAEGLRRWRGYSSNFTRKVIHIGVGMMSWFIHLLFDSPWWFVAAALTFAVLNFLDWQYGFLAAMASNDRSNLGTVYFPIAAAVTAVIFWSQPPLMVAALMPLAWGDGLAPVVGRAIGKRAYTFRGATRTLEGSAGFWIATLVTVWLALWLTAGEPVITPAAAILPALVIATVTTLVESVSVGGLDNLTITAAAIILIQLWPF